MSNSFCHTLNNLTRTYTSNMQLRKHRCIARWCPNWLWKIRYFGRSSCHESDQLAGVALSFSKFSGRNGLPCELITLLEPPRGSSLFARPSFEVTRPVLLWFERKKSERNPPVSCCLHIHDPTKECRLSRTGTILSRSPGTTLH